ncbi:MAG TPA: FtsQ-type POTRA domain-containing protein [Gaiellaceae bacterium]|jgi:cell division protein FtsQ
MAECPASRTPPTTAYRPLLVVAIALVLVGSGVGAYFGARETGIFALDRIQVAGAPPTTAARIRAALRTYVGKSLVRFDRNDAARRLASVPEVADARFDRDFPHTLRVRVHLERAVALLRRGPDAWVVSSSARVLEQLRRRPYPRLPRIWLPATADVTVNSTLSGVGARGVAAVAPLGALHLTRSVRQVLVGDGQLTLVLAAGTELRLGDSGDLRLKLAIARRILPLAAGAAYVDISVPERPVAGYNSQVAG